MIFQRIEPIRTNDNRNSTGIPLGFFDKGCEIRVDYKTDGFHQGPMSKQKQKKNTHNKCVSCEKCFWEVCHVFLKPQLFQQCVFAVVSVQSGQVLCHYHLLLILIY